mgnify:CR=1 FL=1|tara:strand:+ start:582 stop:1262 length:681 start_codon:yes stop_codon:yes gene_type:complete
MTEPLKEFTYSKHSQPSKLIVMLHGYGDNAENFINIASYLDLKEWGAQYIALNAPTSIPNYPIGKQWFDIYPNGKYISEASSAEILVIRKEISVAIQKIEMSINYNLKKFKLSHNKCVLLGFSQGGMMAFEFGNYFQNTLGAIAIFSGRIMVKKDINNTYLKQSPIFISHGNKDDILNIDNFYKSIAFLKKNDFNFESHEIKEDTHTISAKSIELFQKFIKNIYDV